MASAATSTVPRPSSPPISVLARPPLLPGRSLTSSNDSTSSNSGQSLSSILSTPPDSINDGHSKRSSRAPPPSAYQRSRYSTLVPAIFRGEDTRSDVLSTLKSIEKEWELVAPSAVIPADTNSSPRRNKSGLKPASSKMSTTDMSRQSIQKKPSFLRRLTKSSESPPPPVPPTGPPQLPRLSTLLSDNTTLVASVTKSTAANGGANGLMSGTKYAAPPSHFTSPPSHSLPPGAAAPATMSPPNGSAWRNSNNQSSGFRVQSRPVSYGEYSFRGSVADHSRRRWCPSHGSTCAP